MHECDMQHKLEHSVLLACIEIELLCETIIIYLLILNK